MKLSWVHNRAYTGYRKYIGVREDGKRQVFYLGADRCAAEAKAMELLVEYRRLLAGGASGWTESALSAIAKGENKGLSNESVSPQPQTPPKPPSSQSPQAQPPVLSKATRKTVATPSLMLHAALDQYIESETRKAPHQITYAYVQGQRIRVRRIKAAMFDRPLAAIGYDELAEAVAYFASRPKSEKTGQKLGVVTVTDAIKGIRAAFDWFDLSGRWEAPRRFERIFRVKRRHLMTSDERETERQGVPTFTVEELTKIMSMAWTRWHRVFIMTALNLAMTQNELSTLTRRHLIGLDTDSPAVEKCREKTDIFCRWGFIFPEVAEGLRWLLSTHRNQIIFASTNGKPPVRFSALGRIDTVSSWWGRLVKRAGVTPLSFRFLRKTAADMVRKLSDRDTSEAMLSHSNDGMAKAYTNHDWEKLTDALKKLHVQIAPIFVVPNVRPVIPRPNRKSKNE